jgi:hypothetical protein
MKLRLLLAAVVVLAVAPAAQANDPPYPACSPATPFTWHAGARVFATSSYVVSLNVPATEIWARVGATGTWQRAPVRQDLYGAWTTIVPVLGQGDLAVGFRSGQAGSPCLALEERHVLVKHRVQLDRLRAVPRGGVLRVSAFRAGRGCHSLGDGPFRWRFRAGGKARSVMLGNACGPLDGSGVPTAGAVVRTSFFSVRVGTAARPGAPAGYLEVRAAHPRRSGKVRFNLVADWTNPEDTRGEGVVIGVTVTVHYQPGSHPRWRTAVRFGRFFPPAGGQGGGKGGGGVVLGPGSGSGGDGPVCNGLDC